MTPAEAVPLPEATFALVSALAWALSTPVISRGLAGMREHGTEERYDICLGLAASLVSGVAVLSVVTLPSLSLSRFPTFLVLAGVFTFPVGTGLYYYTGARYRNQAEIAAQFVKIKPIFSVGFAVLLGELVGRAELLALGCIAIGLGFLVLNTVREDFRLLAAGFGLGTALSWAIGDAFVKLGIANVSGLVATYLALVTGTALYLLVAGPVAAGRADVKSALRTRWLVPFLGHGVLSFGIAYTAFFTSIKRIGLAETALITAFWPILAIGFDYALDRFRVGSDADTPSKYLLAASAMLVTGSAISAL